jgi:hypothetical protein
MNLFCLINISLCRNTLSEIEPPPYSLIYYYFSSPSTNPSASPSASPSTSPSSSPTSSRSPTYITVDQSFIPSRAPTKAIQFKTPKPTRKPSQNRKRLPTTKPTLKPSTLKIISPQSPITILKNYRNMDSFGFKSYSFQYTAKTSSATLEFAFFHNDGYWQLDDTSVLDNSMRFVDLLRNFDFEKATLSGWKTKVSLDEKTFYGNVYGTKAYSAHGGVFSFIDNVKNNLEYISQTFPTTIGQTYTILFWLKCVSYSKAKNQFSATITAI